MAWSFTGESAGEPRQSRVGGRVAGSKPGGAACQASPGRGEAADRAAPGAPSTTAFPGSSCGSQSAMWLRPNWYDTPGRALWVATRAAAASKAAARDAYSATDRVRRCGAACSQASYAGEAPAWRLGRAPAMRVAGVGRGRPPRVDGRAAPPALPPARARQSGGTAKVTESPPPPSSSSAKAGDGSHPVYSATVASKCPSDHRFWPRATRRRGVSAPSADTYRV